MNEELKQLNKAELAGIAAAQLRFQAAQAEVAAAQQGVREMLEAVGLDPDGAFSVTQEGVVTVVQGTGEPTPMNRAARRAAKKAPAAAEAVEA